jgi:anhydro-N-acetylmuramic acid kinase
MSGTSLDGLDLAYCEFRLHHGTWSYSILHATTIPYSTQWQKRLSDATLTSGAQFVQLDTEYGHLLGRLCRTFITKHQIRPDFIASHGHTVFHRPSLKITSQIGKGSAIASETGLPVVCDFRSGDVALGGTGAPLVPIGDKLLFGSYDCCLNLGGFANISYDNKEGARIAFDICPVNITINYLSYKEGKPYDAEGTMARKGILQNELMEALNQLDFYHKPPPKSLGKEWFEAHIIPLMDTAKYKVPDLLRTFTEHAAFQIACSVSAASQKRILVTGGGAYNKFLLERLKELISAMIIIPDFQTIKYKEALIFAFLGVLRMRNEINILRSVTGAKKDSSGGAIY